MDKISINNIFLQSPDNSRPLDVNMMFDVGGSNKTKTNFDIDKLIKLREERRSKILVQYEKIFNMVLNKIMAANKMNSTEMIYAVPDALYGHFDYNQADCAKHVADKLTGLGLDAAPLADHTIYISWLDLENNIKKKEANGSQ